MIRACLFFILVQTSRSYVQLPDPIQYINKQTTNALRNWHLQDSGIIDCPYYPSKTDFQAYVNTIYGFKLGEVSSGPPDLSVSSTECQDHADSVGGGFSGINSWTQYPSGCVLAVGLNAFLFNTNTNSLPCGNIDSGGSTQRNCIQKGPAKSVRTIIDATLPHGALYKPGYYQRATGSPDMSVSIQKCSTLGIGSFTSVVYWDAYPSGCVINAADARYFNIGTGDCGYDGFKCIQKNDPYYEQLSGSPDLSVSLSECQAYAESTGQTWDSATSEIHWSAVPKGCYICGSISCTGNYENLIQYNTNGAGINCNPANRPGENCIQKGIPFFFNVPPMLEEVSDFSTPLSSSDEKYVTEPECAEFAAVMGAQYATANYGADPAGCFRMPSGSTYFNTYTGSTNLCGWSSKACVQKKYSSLLGFQKQACTASTNCVCQNHVATSGSQKYTYGKLQYNFETPWNTDSAKSYNNYVTRNTYLTHQLGTCAYKMNKANGYCYDPQHSTVSSFSYDLWGDPNNMGTQFSTSSIEDITTACATGCSQNNDEGWDSQAFSVFTYPNAHYGRCFCMKYTYDECITMPGASYSLASNWDYYELVPTAQYYTQEECDFVGGIFNSTSDNNLERHFDVLDVGVVSAQEDNEESEKNSTYLTDIYAIPTDQFALPTDSIVSYSRTYFREFVGKETALSDRNKALADCTAKCKANDDCSYISLKANNECMLYRKCEQTTNDIVESFKEVSSGMPDMSLSQSECQSYMDSLGYGITVEANSAPNGCSINYNNPDPQKGFFNTNTVAYSCQGVTMPCIQKSYTESTDVDTYRKVGFHATKESSNGLTEKGVYHDAATETFLCKNYNDGIRLHNFFFNREDTNTILSGSTFNHLHALTDIWPAQKYVHFDNDIWISNHPTKTFLKYHTDIESYVGYLQDTNADTTSIGPRYGFLQNGQTCDYILERQDCINFANVQLYNVGDMDLAGKEMYYTHTDQDDQQCRYPLIDASVQTDNIDEAKCNEYRELYNYVGETLSTNQKPIGCSVFIDSTGQAIPEVTFNNYGAAVDIAVLQTAALEEGKSHNFVCYGNPNRFNPKGCYLDTKNNLHYNADTQFSECSNEKQCLCSYAVGVFDINGGIKEASNEELCASVCADTENCNYLQLHDDVCYGLDACDTTNTYEWSLQHDWTYCTNAYPDTGDGIMTISPYYQKTSGVPDASMTYPDCQVYATEIGSTDFGSNVNNPGPGCVVDTNKAVRYNPSSCHNSDPNQCLCSASNICIQRSESVFQEQLDECANKCGAEGYTSEYVYVRKAYNKNNYDYTKECAAANCNTNFADLPPFTASSLRECFYLWGGAEEPNEVSFDPLTGNCWKEQQWGYPYYTNAVDADYQDKQMKCYCLPDSCPSATMYQNFTLKPWNQIYNRRVITEATTTSKVFKIKGKHSAFELFPYTGFWDCDAVRFTEVATTQDCSAHARSLHHFVYSYNAETKVCIVYTHYVQDAHEQLLQMGENAEWCYKGNELRGYDGFIIRYGTCSDDITGRDVVVHRNCDMAVKDALNGSQCLTWEVAESHYYEVDSGPAATLGVEVTSGTPVELGSAEYMTVEECEALAISENKNHQMGWPLSWGDTQSGCSFHPDNNYYFFNSHDNDLSCNVIGRPCIQKSPTYAAYVSEAECQLYASSVNKAMSPVSITDGSNWVNGCQADSSNVYWNAYTTSTKQCDTATNINCIQKSTNHSVPITAEFRKGTLPNTYYENVVEANEACMTSSECNYIYHDTHFSAHGRYALYRSLHYVKGEQQFDGRFARKGSCSLSHTIYEEKSSGSPANGPMLYVTSGEPAKGPYMAVSSGEPASDPYMAVNSGSPAVIGDSKYVSEAECQLYASSVNKAMSPVSITDGSNWINGCQADSSNVYWNAYTTSTKQCDTATNINCIQKNPDYDEARYVSESECEAYGLSMGDSNGLTTSIANGYPAGCFKRASGYFYGSGTDGTLCTATNACIQKQIPDPDYVSAEECEAYSNTVGFNYAGFISASGAIKGCYLVPSTAATYYNTDKSSTKLCSESDRACIKKNLRPDLRYVSKEDCEAYAEANGMNFETVSAAQVGDLAPWGCLKNLWVSVPKIQWNPDQTDVGDCGDTTGSGYYCIQKVPNKAFEITDTGFGTTYKGYDPYHCTYSTNVRSQLDLSSYDIFTCATGDVEWTGFVEVTSGTPNLSISESECQQYAASVGANWGGTETWTGPANGCVVFSGGSLYFIENGLTNECDHNPDYKCIQKYKSTTGTLTECEDACANDPTCSIVSYHYDTRFCRYGVGNRVSSINLNFVEVSDGSAAAEGDPKWVSEAECEQVTFGHGYSSTSAFDNYASGCIDNGNGYIYWNTPTNEGDCGHYSSKCIQKYIAPSLVCSYDRDKASFLGFVPEQTCEAEFTPHNDPSLDKFRSYMLGNIEYNVGGTRCSDCPQGQYPITTYGYTCETGVQRNNYCADASDDDGDCMYGFAGNMKLYDCKLQCDQQDNCNIINFITELNFEKGSCYLFSNVQKSLPTDNPSSVTCERIQTSSECTPCAVGKYKRITGQTVCSSCGVGTYQDETGQASCKACAENTFQAQSGKTSCNEIDMFYIVYQQASRDINYDNMVDQLILTFTDVTTQTECMEKVGLAGKKIMIYSSNTNPQTCMGFHVMGGISNLQAHKILSMTEGFIGNGLELQSGAHTAYSLGLDKRVCVGSLLVGIASGPLQDNSVTDTPNNREGGTSLCDGCADFQIEVPGRPDECQSCTPGFYYTEVPSVRCESCEPGFARETETTLGPDDEYNVYPFTEYDVNPMPDGSGWPAVGPESFRCIPCEPGKYQPAIEQTTCIDCPVGKYTDSWFNEECKDCPIGQYMNAQGHIKLTTDEHACDLCPMSYSQSLEGQQYCQLCARGTYSDQLGLVNCKTCLAGRYTPWTGSNKASCDEGESFASGSCCQDCPPGAYSNENQYQWPPPGCTACPAGRVNDLYGAYECKACPIGRYMSLIGAKHDQYGNWGQCNVCNQGYAAVLASPSCTGCNDGKYQPQQLQEFCLDCPVGRWSNTYYTGFSSCFHCGAGTYMDETGANVCKNCQNGQYRPEYGENVDCIDCPVGQYGDWGPGWETGYDVFKAYQGIEIGWCAGTLDNGRCEFQEETDYTSPWTDEWAYGTSFQALRRPQYIACKYCIRGQYQDQEGQTDCLWCPAGKHGPWGGASRESHCQDCPSGYNAGTGYSYCMPNSYYDDGASLSDDYPRSRFPCLIIDGMHADWPYNMECWDYWDAGSSFYNSLTRKDGCETLYSNSNNYGIGSLIVPFQQIHGNWNNFEPMMSGACKYSRIICDHIVGPISTSIISASVLANDFGVANLNTICWCLTKIPGYDGTHGVYPVTHDTYTGIAFNGISFVGGGTYFGHFSVAANDWQDCAYQCQFHQACQQVVANTPLLAEEPYISYSEYNTPGIVLRL